MHRPEADAAISVIVPAYNSEKWLKTALGSIAAQTTAPAEVVVVDDCSTDRTSDVAQAWRDVLPLVLVKHTVNRGLGATRRTGIERSRFPLIALLDADDAWLPDHLEVLHRVWEEHGGLVTARALRWAPGRALALRDTGRRVSVPPPAAQLRAAYRENFVFPTVLFSRTDYTAAGGFSELRKSEDWDLWVRMLRCGVRVALPDQPTTLYRLSTSSLSAGHGTLETDIALLERWRDDADPEHRPVVAAALRRRQARQRLLRAFSDAEGGHAGRGRVGMVQAALIDRSFRGGAFGSNSSVTLQALAGLVAWRRVQHLRHSRAEDLQQVVDR